MMTSAPRPVPFCLSIPSAPRVIQRIRSYGGGRTVARGSATVFWGTEAASPHGLPQVRGALWPEHGRHQATAGPDPQLAVHVAEVILDRVHADHELGGDLPVGLAGGDQAGDRALLRGEPVGFPLAPLG